MVKHQMYSIKSTIFTKKVSFIKMLFYVMFYVYAYLQTKSLYVLFYKRYIYLQIKMN